MAETGAAGSDLNRAASAVLAAGAASDAAALRSAARLIGEEAARLLAVDRDGRWWPIGLLAACHRAAASDTRLGFLDAMPRSMAFGARLADMTVRAITGGPAAQDALELGRLVNLFVTAFDGVCDNRPDLLPALLPELRERFDAFPATFNAPSRTGEEAIIRLVLEAASSAFGMLEHTVIGLPAAEIEALAATLREAVAAEIATLSLVEGHVEPEAIMDGRMRVSVATFAATMTIAAIRAEAGPKVLRSLRPLADAAGCLCAFIDDLADREIDAREGRPNIVSMMLGRVDPGRHTASIAARTEELWSDLATKARKLPHPDAILEPMRMAMLAWIADPAMLTINDPLHSQNGEVLV